MTMQPVAIASWESTGTRIPLFCGWRTIAAKTLSRRSSQLPTTFVARLPSRKAYSVRTRRDSQAGAVTPGLNCANWVLHRQNTQRFKFISESGLFFLSADRRQWKVVQIYGPKQASMPARRARPSRARVIAGENIVASDIVRARQAAHASRKPADQPASMAA